jgi:hypothetical protein
MIILLYAIFHKDIECMSVNIDRYKKVTIWGFAIILVLIAKLNINNTDSLLLVCVCVISILLVFLRDNHTSYDN